MADEELVKIPDEVLRPDHPRVDLELHVKVQDALREYAAEHVVNWLRNPMENPQGIHHINLTMKSIRQSVIDEHLKAKAANGQDEAQKEPPVDNPDSPPNK
jgi:hypothetical protein